MNTETQTINVNGIQVQVVRKNIKNLHLGVYPPSGRVRVAAPEVLSNDAVRLAVVAKLGWIKRQQAAFNAQERQSKRQIVGGESHDFLGRRYRLRFIPASKSARITLRGKSYLEMHASADLTHVQREQVLQRWYRQQLKQLIPSMLEEWSAVLGVETPTWGIKRMKTKWGSCNIGAKRIWLNLELIKKPLRCLEYVIVHELVHLLERHHNDHFMQILDSVMPMWRSHRTELNRLPLAHEDWSDA